MDDRKKKRIPQRTCIACRKVQDKPSMIRISCYGGHLTLDEDGKAKGRGAYICRNPICIEKVWKHKLLNRAFHMKVNQEEIDKIKKKIGDGR